MPIENERKIVLFGLDSSTFSDKWTKIQITQAYIKDNRIRKATFEDGKSKFYFTAKHEVGEDLFEFEMEITQTEYNKLLTIAESKLFKTRFTRKFKGDTWDVDIFGNIVDPYFVMAEVEMDPDKDDFTEAPSIIDACRWVRVSKGDKRFTSKRLTDEMYAREMYRMLETEYED